jgi:hypothetical protein
MGLPPLKYFFLRKRQTPEGQKKRRRIRPSSAAGRCEVFLGGALFFQRTPQITHEAFGDGDNTVAAALVTVALIDPTSCSLSRFFGWCARVFIPWRVGAEESGAANFGFGGAMLLDVLGPPQRLLAARWCGRRRRRRRFRFSSPSGVAGPAADETLLLCGRVVGTEVGIPFGAIKPEF